MGQRWIPIPNAALTLLVLLFIGCDGKPASPAAPAGTRPRVASLVPAATDLLLGMGAGDHLVAISNYDIDREGTRSLPRVGDYQSLDWERLSVLRPDIMIVFMTPDRMPEGLKQRADRLGIKLMNVRTERLEDVFLQWAALGKAVHEEKKAEAAIARLRSQLDEVRKHVAGKPKVRTLIVREKGADGVVGVDNFLNDALEIAGGENVVRTPGWPSIDREMLLSLKPEVIIQLLPEASPQVVGEAKQFWAALPHVPAVASGRVHILTQWFTLQPGSHLGQTAKMLASLLHPDAPATRPVGDLR
jgi:iron complex transport system substrate-binding protein